jgi:septal ring factor EnvC (AmiA/AmiB activator)
MSERWQVDRRLLSPLIGRRFMPLIAICGFLVLTSGLILWATGGNSAAVVASSTAAVAPVQNDLAERTRDLEVTEQQAIDQLQVVQDQLAAQQSETRKLASQLEALNDKLDSIQQSLSEMSTPAGAAAASSSKVVRKGHN